MDCVNELWKIKCPYCNNNPEIKNIKDYTDDSNHLVQCKLCNKVFLIKLVRPIEYLYGKEKEFKDA